MVLFSVLDFRHLICCCPVSCIFYVFFCFSDVFVMGGLLSGCIIVALEMVGIRQRKKACVFAVFSNTQELPRIHSV